MQEQYQWEPDPDMEATRPAPIKRALKKDSLLVFFRNLATLTASGKQLVDSLEIAAKESSDANVESMANEIAKKLREGEKLENVVHLYSNMFTDTSRALFLAAAKSGNMDDVLKLIADNEENRGAKRRRVLQVLMQPALILAASFLLIVIAPLFFVDQIRSFVDALGVPMPLVSRIVFGISDLLRPQYLIPILLIAATVIGLARLHWTTEMRSDWILGRAIIFGHTIRPISAILKSVGQAQWAQVVALQIDAGIPLTKAIRTAKTALQDPLFKYVCTDLVKSIEEGASLAEAMRDSNYFTKLVTAIVEVGEESGALPEMLRLVHASCEEDFHVSMDMLEKLIGPLCMCFCGLLVGIWCIAIMLPMAAMLQTLG